MNSLDTNPRAGLNVDERLLTLSGQGDTALFRYRLRTKEMGLYFPPEYAELNAQGKKNLAVKRKLSPRMREITDIATWITAGEMHEAEENFAEAKESYDQASEAFRSFLGDHRFGKYNEIAEALYEDALERRNRLS